ncbi:hypothetical protein PoB_005920800 [Plakobranchus ocellatus]|uniref:Uncharacterized protein n=1 Tax=Plakobranchus ocellatus TaxID=259542 RepID=A0AAV4CLN1_9GAST|nr:hypothetical protein PoB_005920800 [Plakobranchus ocellatus]
MEEIRNICFGFNELMWMMQEKLVKSKRHILSRENFPPSIAEETHATLGSAHAFLIVMQRRCLKCRTFESSHYAQLQLDSGVGGPIFKFRTHGEKVIGLNPSRTGVV